MTVRVNPVVRCPHKRVLITEYGGWITEHERENGTWGHCNIPGNYNSRLDVKCHDCGMERTYWRHSKRLPNWLRTALAELGI